MVDLACLWLGVAPQWAAMAGLAMLRLTWVVFGLAWHRYGRAMVGLACLYYGRLGFVMVDLTCIRLGVAPLWAGNGWLGLSLLWLAWLCYG
jgi:hypothetical protein